MYWPLLHAFNLASRPASWSAVAWRTCPMSSSLLRSQHATQVLRFSSVGSSGKPKNEDCVGWSIPGLRKETERLIYRQKKKIGKAELRHRKAATQATGAPEGVTVEDCLAELDEAMARLDALEQLREGLLVAKGDAGLRHLEALITELGVKDSPPDRQSRGPKKPKGKRDPPRKGYRAYTSADGIEIWVGKKAEDNDVLSLTAARETPRGWWMHAAGSAGSHVVICCDDSNPPEETILDAAVLAAKFSKAGKGGRAQVSLTRCRNVSKPTGAKPGLVRLSGDISSIRVDMKASAGRLERLENTVN